MHPARRCAAAHSRSCPRIGFRPAVNRGPNERDAAASILEGARGVIVVLDDRVLLEHIPTVVPGALHCGEDLTDARVTVAERLVHALSSLQSRRSAAAQFH